MTRGFWILFAALDVIAGSLARWLASRFESSRRFPVVEMDLQSQSAEASAEAG